MTLFETVFDALNKAGVKYLVVGGAAVNLYGFPRFTGDLDILLLLKQENLNLGRPRLCYLDLPLTEKLAIPG